MIKIASLNNRTVLKISGADSEPFLQNLVTCDVEGLAVGQASFGALLTPQGKVLFDFIVSRFDGGHYVDVNKNEAKALSKRLGFYKLRADVTIELTDLDVQVSWPDNAFDTGIQDPRYGELGYRAYGIQATVNADQEDWESICLNCGIPQSGADFQLGEVFPHDVLMDQFKGVDFQKGCYVGQEVVSRMHHRGTARNRIVKMRSKDGSALDTSDIELQSKDKKIGTAGSTRGAIGLALVRTDRAVSAIHAGETILLGSREVELARPDFADYDWAT